MDRNLSIMIKPASAKCNANCKYCFYRDEVEVRSVKDYGNMRERTAEVLIEKVLSYVEGGNLSIVFQGGEPTLRGYDFFKFFFETIRTKNVGGAKIYLSLQTNGLLINEKWAKLFKEHNVLVGVSLDGDRKSNSQRIAKGKEIFKETLECTRILKENDVSFNVLSVIHNQNVKRGKFIYEDLVKRNFRNLQFIPYLGDSEEFNLTSEDYAKFLSEIYALYARDFHTQNPTRIRQFDNYLMLLKTGRAEQCGMNGCCEESLTFEGDGTAFPCDFYCTDDYELGSIHEKDIEELLYSDRAVAFRNEKAEKEECKVCPYYKVCRGGCKRYAQDSRFCKAYKLFFKNSF